VRRDQPDLEYDSAGNLKQRQKYLSPPGRPNMLYLARGASQLFLRDDALPVVITEGEFKTLALWRLAHHGSPDRPRFLPLGVSGVYNWRGTIGKTVGPDGSRLDVKGAIPDLDWVAWQGRRVVIAYDADAVTKDLVRIARSELAAHLRGRGALVGFLEWDVARGKGIDDHLALVGPETVLDDTATDLPADQEVLLVAQPEQPAHNFPQKDLLLGEGCGEPVPAAPPADLPRLFALSLVFPATGRCGPVRSYAGATVCV
jgi:hypothetical protein